MIERKEIVRLKTDADREISNRWIIVELMETKKIEMVIYTEYWKVATLRSYKQKQMDHHEP